MENNLPKGWVECSLGDVCSKPQYGWTSKAGHTGEIKYLRTTDISNGNLIWETVPYCIELPSEIEKYQVKKNDILVSRAGSVGFNFRIKEDVPFNAVFASYLIRFKACDEIMSRYIDYFLKSEEYWSQISDFTVGIAIPNVNATKLEELQIPIPPLPEQQRIVAKLDAVMQKVESNKERVDKIPKLLKRFRQSVLNSAVSGKLTVDWREKNGVIDEWEEKTIGELTESSFYGPRFSKEEYSHEGIPTLRTTDFNIKGQIKLNDPPKINLTNSQIEKFKILKNDILITRTGSIGTLAIFKEDYIAIPSAYLIRFRFFNTVSPDFIFLFFLSPFGQELLGINATSVTQANVNAEKIKSFQISLPPPEEQKEIVRRVEQLFVLADKIEARYTKAKTMLDKLPQSVLAKAFRGKLVPQDPNDEPASVLLERIKAEREKLSAGKKRKIEKRTSMKKKIMNSADNKVKYKRTKSL